METVLKVILTIISSVFLAITGAAIGAVIGFYGLYYFCVFMDDGHGQAGAGFALAYITIPLGMLLGGGLGCSIPVLFWAKWK
ncbi:hypothetical protein [Gimesia aquarii]|uniref:Uncharacterized protein n=1 Tax=Gimesia aquarii TaxID=2527964 RepID=A0A517WQX5_9PLAN|nr:hypothetical protein [Gimesia aquarii]QDU07666.1 hypothetical protein V202x_10250 [Gimesia aquarii]